MPKHVVTVAAALAALAALGGCGEDTVVTVAQEPALQVRVQAAPDSVDTGMKVVVQAIVERAPAGAGLEFGWLADAGSFSDSRDDSTGWTAPDNPGVYGLSVVVTDGDNVAIGKANVAVAVYAPAVQPFYLGVSSCSVCHNGGPGGTQYATWSESAHARALESLAGIGQDENPVCLGCHTVGTYGLNADAALANGGYDETAVPRLAGVQCENCHGPGSQHPSPDFTSVDVTMDAGMCGQCHNGTHHPTFDEWKSSQHGDESTWLTTPALRANCAKCHNGLVSMAYLDDPNNFVNPPSNPTEFAAHTCAVCHDPHGNDNPGMLRDASVTDASLPNAILVEEAGAGRLCISCHNGRRTETDVLGQINNGSTFFGPHHSIQGDMLKGVNAYQALAPAFQFRSSKHILVEDACVACHTHRHEADPTTGNTLFTGHTFLPTVEACARCHGDIADFADIEAKGDFDGDGTIEGVQNEVQGLLDLLQQVIIDASTSDAIKMDFQNDFLGTLGNATKSTRAQREAGYNWTYVGFDGSTGVHNTTYAVQLLQQSILYLAPGALPAAATLLEDDL
jgi:predicted CXXCH cytochrome family protein